ncbi:ABC transporter permease [Paenibacillus sp. FSL H8-0048]|uniref:ABC transporter permease n=1 Tax=Paenibacillus sp. FSL H8-0048 TaxID=2954508 RepID=UPI0030F4DDBD
MLRSVAAEWAKLRRSRMGLVLVSLPVVSLMIGCANFVMNREVLEGGWYSLWTQVSLFYGEFFLPILIAICCAFVCRLEHVNRNWNMILAAPVPIAGLFIAKLVIVGVLIAGAQALFLLMYWAAGRMLSMTGAFPLDIILWTFRGWVAALSIAALQLGLSIRIRSFATPIGISLCAVFVGLGLYVLKLGLLFPYSLLTIGMGVLTQRGLTPAENLLFFSMSGVYLVILSAWSIRRLKYSAAA